MGSQPPQASEDSFSDDEDDLTGHEAQANEKQENKTGLPRHIMERLEKRRTKEGRKAERQARSNRARKAQEIQRELEELEVEQVDGIIIIIIIITIIITIMEQVDGVIIIIIIIVIVIVTIIIIIIMEQVDVEERGVQLEQLLREEEAGEAMGEWYRLLSQKNRLVRREQELMVGSKQLELEDQAERLEDKLGRGRGEGEGEVLEQLLQNAEQRELLSAMLARDKERLV